MILDNENRKVHEWIEKHTGKGTIQVVTGYFTIGALAWMSEKLNEKISRFDLVLGEMSGHDSSRDRTIDLLNERISLDAALQLHQLARQAVTFLKQEKVLAKTLEPNFCHAKATVFHCEDDEDNHYFIQGSSNMTEAGIGLRRTSNVELNMGARGAGGNFKEMADWFDSLWYKHQAHSDKTIKESNGRTRKVDFKKYLIEQISRVFAHYTPEVVYFKMLFELFGEQVSQTEGDLEFSRQIGRLENTEIYQALYDFQQKGTLSLIKMLKNYNGAILADAVGLGKTWTALAVMKYFQMQGRELLLLCPKKLHHNWLQYKKHHNSRFEADALEYFIRFHTDLQEDRFEKYNDRADKLFSSDKPLLLVIDESHNLRNDQSNRYRFLIEKLLRHKADVKVLLLSATPINNSLQDIRNQFKIMVKGDVTGFHEVLGIKNLDYTFRVAEKKFRDWSLSKNPQISIFVKSLPANFFSLTDALTVARTRQMIEGIQNGLNFPKKMPPKNLFVTPKEIGDYESFEELFDEFPPKLSGYMPSLYLDDNDDEKSPLEDEKQRDFFLVKMMYILMVKRLESSWAAFQTTVEKIRAHHQQVLDRIKIYQEEKKQAAFDSGAQMNLFDDDDELQNELETHTIGKKRKVKIADIDAAGTINEFKKDLKADIKQLDLLEQNLEKFQTIIAREKSDNSKDEKLAALLKEIKLKRQLGHNRQNPKVIIFTVYRDTASYLFNELGKRGFSNYAMVAGDYSLIWDDDQTHKNFESILQRFAPFTKLFKEKRWEGFNPELNTSLQKQFADWQAWVLKYDPRTAKKLEQPIDILITTDALSEGQNLQDCDLVINYDIHWNPVRVIQRFGRIDRLGSPNDHIFGINFWPTDNINAYLDLQGRIERRMAAMKLAGAEVPDRFSKTFEAMNDGDLLESMQKKRMMEQMQVSWEDIEVGEEQFGFDDLSLEKFRQDLLGELKKTQDFYLNMPKGVFSGFIRNPEILPADGIVALFGFPAKKSGHDQSRYPRYEVVYCDFQGKSLLENQKEILEMLSQEIKTNPPRQLPDGIDAAEVAPLEKITTALRRWVKSRATEEIVQADGSVKTVMGESMKDKLKRLKSGDKTATEEIKTEGDAAEFYTPENSDLIAWLVVHSEK
ncbi:MAG: RNA polymerase-associated protein RapA [Saprospiraceae bacterium]|nr:RNA polymerase-associated protein RapA [Saprospiraceae bacterium]